MKGGKFPKRVVPASQLQQCTAPLLDFSHYLIMPTLTLSQKEVNLLNSIFAAVADLDLNEHLEDEDDSTFDSLWDKVVKL